MSMAHHETLGPWGEQQVKGTRIRNRPDGVDSASAWQSCLPSDDHMHDPGSWSHRGQEAPETLL